MSKISNDLVMLPGGSRSSVFHRAAHGDELRHRWPASLWERSIGLLALGGYVLRGRAAVLNQPPKLLRVFRVSIDDEVALGVQRSPPANRSHCGQPAASTTRLVV